jgi:DNA-binding MarR family transcriptional regulator
MKKPKKLDFTDDLKELLYIRFKIFEVRLLKNMKSTEYDYLTLSQMRVFALMRGCEMTISTLAKLMNVSRQATQKTVSSLVTRGLLELTECPDNRSAKLIKLTADGQMMWQKIKMTREKIERDVAVKIGAYRFKLLKEILKEEWGII